MGNGLFGFGYGTECMKSKTGRDFQDLCLALGI
jgi:hypothetical protein